MKKWLKTILNEEPEAEQSIRALRPVYAIGDIHGCLDLARRMFDEIDEDRARLGIEDSLIVGLGDYIDRGPQSCEVVELLRERMAAEPDMVLLRGNHEAFLTDFLKNPVSGSFWLKYGGVDTLKSYGLEDESVLESVSLLDVRDHFIEALGPHAGFYTQTLCDSYREGPFLFTHAGIDPTLPVDRQPRRAFVHGHPDFMRRGGKPGLIVVHGHYITNEPEIGRYRIGVDTGAYMSGVLSAAMLIENRVRFLRVETPVEQRLVAAR